MSDKLTDHDIASLYKKGANERPSEALDKHILQLAQQHSQSKKITPIHKKRRLYQTWYGQLSTAASLVLVALLYFENSDTLYNMPDAADDEIYSSDSLDEAIENLPTAPVSSKQQAVRLKQDKTLQESIRQEKVNREKAKQEKVKQAKSRSQQAELKRYQMMQTQQLESAEISAEMQDVHQSEQLMQSSAETEALTKAKPQAFLTEAELKEIEQTFKQIETLINRGENDQAQKLLSRLNTAYPRLQKEFELRYQKLTTPTINQ